MTTATMEPEPVKAQVVEPTALGAITREEIDIQIATAHRFPRSLERFRSQALDMATCDEETAAGCFFHLPRGRKMIDGESVRLAEIVASAWGNLRVASRITNVGGKMVTAEAVCHDLETNVAISREVQERITYKDGKRYNDDMIRTASNSACSKALRNAIFTVIPRVYVKAVAQAAERVAIGDASTLAERRAKMVEHFGGMGVTVEMICRLVDKPGIDDVGLTDLGRLIGVANAIRDGDTTVDEAFAVKPKADAKPGKTLKDVMEERKAGGDD